jgi:ubiquinone/menaquinone biosynthesis C-methylase UbiE
VRESTFWELRDLSAMVAATSHPDYPARHHYQRPESSENYDRRRFSSVYGAFVDRLEKRALRRMLRHLPSEAVVLELACGTGRMTQVATTMGLRVVGLDISRGMLDNAVRRVGGDPHLMGWIRGESETLPLASGSVDAVMSCRFLPRLNAEGRSQVFREIHRVSRRYAVLQFSTAWSVLFRFRVWWAVRHGKTPRFTAPRSQILAELEAAGFRERRTAFVLPGVAQTYVTLLERSVSPGSAT